MEQKRCISSLTLAELTAALKAMGSGNFRIYPEVKGNEDLINDTGKFK